MAIVFIFFVKIVEYWIIMPGVDHTKSTSSTSLAEILWSNTGYVSLTNEINLNYEYYFTL